MSVVHCPNNSGKSCGLTFRTVNLQDGANEGYFPVLNQTFVRNAGIFQLQANRRSLCQGDTLELSGYGAGAERFLWSVSPAFPASVKLDTLTWQKISTRTLSPGTYMFSCQAFSRCGDVFEKTISVEIKPLPIRPLVSTIQKPVPCKGDSVVFQIQNPQPGYTYFWSTGDTGPVAIARQTGFYALDSVQHPAGCRLPLGDSVGVVIKNALVPPKPQVLSNPTPEICEGQDTWLKLQPQAYTSHWSNNQTGDSIRVDKPGMFWAIHKSEAGCSSSPSDTIQLNVVPFPSLVLLVADSSHCKGREESKSYSYRIQNGGLVNTEVEGGSLTEKTDSTLRISWWAEAPVGIFTLSLQAENRLGCRAPSIRFFPTLNPTSCADLYPLFIPNLITPNKDQRNDQWQLGNLDYHQPVHLTLYNRWGQIIFEASPYKNNLPAGEPSSGSYFYRLRTGQGRELNGWVTVN